MTANKSRSVKTLAGKRLGGSASRQPVPRPDRQAKIDMKVVEGMAGVGATNCEIADFLAVSEALIRKRCDAILTKSRSGLKMRLRKAQINAALGGNPAMLIWLGKQMLEQKDKSDLTSGDKPLLPQLISVRLVQPRASDG